MGRSGSSFLGAVLASIQKSIYFFEPSFSIEKRMSFLKKEKLLESLKQMFRCNISGKFYKQFQNKYNFIYYKRNNCSNNHQCYKMVEINNSCKNSKIRIIKTIRARLSWLWDLMTTYDLDLKIIHLIRDPRASYSSYLRAGMPYNRILCNKTLDDLQSGKILQKFFPKR